MATDRGGLRSLSDRELIARTAGGCDRSLEELMRRYEAPLRWTVHSVLHAPDVADEVLQDVWLSFLREIGRGADP